MLCIILLVLAVLAIMLVIVKHDENSLLLFGLHGSLIAMFSGIIIYTAKIGGLSDAQEVFLFMSPVIKIWLQYLNITLDKLGYLIALGRYLFPTFLLFIAMNYSMIHFVRRYRRILNYLCVIPTALFLILYYPPVFYVVARNRFYFQNVLMESALIWIVLYISLSIFLLVYEYIGITMVYCSRQFRYIIISHISIALLFGLYCFQDPIQVYQLYNVYYDWPQYLSYANPSLTLFEWILLTVATIVFVTLGFWKLISYTQMNYQDGHEDISLQKKYDTASRGISVFVHSVKNQLLSARVVCKKINLLFEEDNPDLKSLKRYTDMMGQMNEDMLSRMEELYRSIKASYIKLTSITVDKIVDMAMKQFNQKYPETSVSVNIEVNATVLADVDQLSEAVCNLLLNAQDAIMAAGRESTGQVELIVHNERLYTVMEIKDNGTGIPKKLRKKIFEPFYTSKNTNYNWGMGLYYVEQIVKSHLGVLRLESIQNEGTSFFIMLPRYNKTTHM
ncbi:sensor histidine kinase [Desulfosporosinus metallidurans]|uniref:histidine kinase n=1 Tax=Desulfosporosinus metallidurans TaxID=1888891 RepID=A0A1Q8QTX5_9FIRM|nr:HAMP domain-containing sensor histidine kinase [Desulfosporosinus metallidurans]OLN30794.1 Sensory box histidine kinase/response regulator [Desulfosporosinus metallidurans]